MNNDFLDYLEENLRDIVESHLDTWKERYYRKSLDSIKYDLKVNYDFSADYDSIESVLERELTDEEKEEYVKRFIETVDYVFYE